MDKTTHPIDDYAQWALQAWRMPGQEDAPWPSYADFAVMGLGFPGECGELLALTEDGVALDHAHAIKELGDALYYWSLLCLSIDDRPGAHWPQGGSESLGSEHGRAKIREQAVALVSVACDAAEGLKKVLRDGAAPDRLRRALARFPKVWIEMCHAMGFSWRSAVEANQEKIRSRQARGSLLGCGDDR